MARVFGTHRTAARRPASPGMPRPVAVFAGGGRCWVRTNVGLADGFTVSPSQPIGIATDLLFLHSPRRVNTAFCPSGVRSPGVCLVSATQVLDHVPSSPAESCCISSSRRRPGTPLSRQPAAANARTPPAGHAPSDTDHLSLCQPDPFQSATATTLEIRSARPSFTPATDSRPRRITCRAIRAAICQQGS